MAETKERGNRKTVKGEVVSKAGDKTIVVRVLRYVQHPLYGKYIRKYTKVKSHDAENKAKVGDFVSVTETRPLSKTKRWRLLEVLTEADQFKIGGKK